MLKLTEDKGNVVMECIEHNEATIDQIPARAQAKINELHKADLAKLKYYPSAELIEELERRGEVLTVGWCPWCERDYDLPPEHLLLEIKKPQLEKPVSGVRHIFDLELGTIERPEEK